MGAPAASSAVSACSFSDRDRLKPVSWQACPVSRVRFFFADAAFAGWLAQWAARMLRTAIHIVGRLATQRGFVVIRAAGRSPAAWTGWPRTPASYSCWAAGSDNPAWTTAQCTPC
jgi:hypothetical protein